MRVGLRELFIELYLVTISILLASTDTEYKTSKIAIATDLRVETPFNIRSVRTLLSVFLFHEEMSYELLTVLKHDCDKVCIKMAGISSTCKLL